MLSCSEDSAYNTLIMSTIVNIVSNDSFESQNSGTNGSDGFVSVSRKKSKKKTYTKAPSKYNDVVSDNLWNLDGFAPESKKDKEKKKEQKKLDKEAKKKEKSVKKEETKNVTNNTIDEIDCVIMHPESVQPIVSECELKKKNTKSDEPSLSSLKLGRLKKMKASKKPNENGKMTRIDDETVRIEFVENVNNGEKKAVEIEETKEETELIETKDCEETKSENGPDFQFPISPTASVVSVTSSESSKSPSVHEKSFHTKRCESMKAEKSDTGSDRLTGPLNEFRNYTTEHLHKLTSSDRAIVANIKKNVRDIVDNQNTRNLHYTVAEREIDTMLQNIYNNPKITIKTIFVLKTLIMMLHQIVKSDLVKLFKTVIQKCKLKKYNMDYIFNSTHDNSSLINTSIWNLSKACITEIIGSGYVNFRVKNVKGETFTDVLNNKLEFCKQRCNSRDYIAKKREYDLCLAYLLKIEKMENDGDV